MQIAEYYDSVAPIWDDDYAEAKAAEISLSRVSLSPLRHEGSRGSLLPRPSVPFTLRVLSCIIANSN